MATRVKLEKNKGGRPVGALSRLAKENRERAAATGELPHEFLLRVARGEVIYRDFIDPVSGSKTQVQEHYDLPVRIDAAKAAAPYFAPKISTVEVINGVPDNELDAIIAQLTAEAGANSGADGESTEDEGSPRPGRAARAKLKD